MARRQRQMCIRDRIIYIQDPETKADGIEILNSVIKSDKLSKDDKIFISEILENYEK